MKTKVFLLTLALFGSCFAEDPKGQPNPEVAKIDARLVELRLIWKKETDTINRLTNFKRTPVQEGSQAYFQCLAASKKIQQVEAEGKELTARKNLLEGQSEIVSGTLSTEWLNVFEHEGAQHGQGGPVAGSAREVNP